MQRPICGGFIARRVRRGDGHWDIHLTSGQFARWHVYGPVTVGIRCVDRSAEVRAVYEADVNPLIVNTAGGCTSSGCHGRAGAPGGLRLYPSSDSNNVQLNYGALVSYIGRRSGNTLLGKISGTAGHGGGARYLTVSSEYQIIEDWVRSVEALP